MSTADFSVAPSCEDVNFKTHIVLKAKDGKHFKLSRAAAAHSGMLRTMLADETEDSVIKLDVEVGSDVLPRFIEYSEHHRDNKADVIPQPLQKKIDEYLCEWDKQFLYTHLVKNRDEKEHKMLLDVMSAAQYFDNDDLLNLTCATVGSIIQDKNPDQIRQLFHLPDDFTDEQRKRNAEELKALADL